MSNRPGSRQRTSFSLRPSAGNFVIVDLAEYKVRRPRQEQTNLLLLAFVVSLIAHILFALAWEFRAHLPHLAWLDWMKKQSAKLDPAALLLKLDQPKPLPPELLKIAALRPTPTEQPMPQLTFVDVDPSLASEPPKDAKFYSATSTRAANPDAKVESNVPKIDGKQTQMVKVQEVSKPQPPPLRPRPRPHLNPNHKRQRRLQLRRPSLRQRPSPWLPHRQSQPSLHPSQLPLLLLLRPRSLRRANPNRCNPHPPQPRRSPEKHFGHSPSLLRWHPLPRL